MYWRVWLCRSERRPSTLAGCAAGYVGSEVSGQTLRFNSQKRLELLDRQSRIADDAAHRERVHRIMSRERHDAQAISHDDVLPLTSNVKACPFQRTHGSAMADACELRHVRP
jgi:hypothetical protein